MSQPPKLSDKHYLASHVGECPTSMPVFDDVVKKPPIAPPKLTAKGCVNGPTDRYVAALETAAHKERDKALAGMGAASVERPGTFVPTKGNGRIVGAVEGRPEGAEFEANGQRYVQVGQGRAGNPVQLAKIGTEVHLIIDLPRSYLVRLKSCGANSCSYGSGAMARDTSVPLAVKLEPGESVGEPMTLHYDQFFLQLEPIKYIDCGQPPP